MFSHRCRRHKPILRMHARRSFHQHGCQLPFLPPWQTHYRKSTVGKSNLELKGNGLQLLITSVKMLLITRYFAEIRLMKRIYTNSMFPKFLCNTTTKGSIDEVWRRHIWSHLLWIIKSQMVDVDESRSTPGFPPELLLLLDSDSSDLSWSSSISSSPTTHCFASANSWSVLLLRTRRP